MTQLKYVIIFTDGACIGNPGPGGFGVVISCQNHRRELSGGYRRTTNNRMEILAAIVGLEDLKERCHVTLYSDSEYTVKAIAQGWAQRWKANNWKRNKSEKALNSDLWNRLLGLCDYHQVEFKWVRGHNGNKENERCDQLAMQAAKRADLPTDKGYEVSLR